MGMSALTFCLRLRFAFFLFSFSMEIDLALRWLVCFCAYDHAFFEGGVVLLDIIFVFMGRIFLLDIVLFSMELDLHFCSYRYPHLFFFFSL